MRTSRSFTTIAEQLTDAVVITDAKGRIDWVNPAFTRLCGYSLSEIKGKKPGDFLQGPETDSAAVRVLHNAVRRGRKASVEIVNYRKGQWPYSVWITLNPIKNKLGETTGYIAIERETTALQNELRQREDDIVHLYDALCNVTSARSA